MFIRVPPQQQQLPAQSSATQTHWNGTRPQDCDRGLAAGFGALFLAIALFAPPPPTYAAAQEYRFGSHEAVIRDSVSQSSRTWNTVKPPVASAQLGRFIQTVPQVYSTYGSGLWCLAEYVTTVTFLSQEVVGDGQEPPYQPSRVWGKSPTGSAVATPVSRMVTAAVHQAVASPPSQVWASEALYVQPIPKALRTLPQSFVNTGSWVRGDIAQFELLLQLTPRPIISTRQEWVSEGVSTTFRIVPAVDQPQGVGAQYTYGSHSWRFDYAGRSFVKGYPGFAAPVGDSVPLRPSIQTLPQSFSEGVSKVTRTFIPPPPVEAPPLRGTIVTSAEVPRNAPSSLWGTHAGRFNPQITLPNGADYRYGTHNLQFDYAGRSKSWGYPGFVPPPIDNPPVLPNAFVVQEYRETPNCSKFWNTVIIGVRIPLVVHEVVGDQDDPPYQSGSTWTSAVLGIIQDPLIRPVFATQAEVYWVPPSSMWKGIIPPVQSPIVRQFGSQAEIPFQYRSSSWNSLIPPVQDTPLRPAIITYPQPDIQLRPSKVWGKPPPTVIPPTIPGRTLLSGHWSAQYYEVNRSQFHIPLQRCIYMGRIVTYPKYQGETERLLPPFDFSQRLASGETILSATVTATVYTGTDPNPSATLFGSPTIEGSKVYQELTGGIVGVIYLLSCTVTTTAAQTLILNTYFYVEPSLP